ncbi:MAG: class I SAM-dependent methyltransferase [Ilumatobacteraceae bacterium]
MDDTLISYNETHVWDADTYESDRRRMLADYDVLYSACAGLALESVPLGGRVLDLGAGTGLLSRFAHRARPDVQIVLLDGDSAMLGRARTHLGDRVPMLHQDLRDPLPDGPWNAVITAMAIHHLEHQDKRALFARIRGALGEGGVFVNAEQILGPTPWLQTRNMRWWEQTARSLGSDDDEIARAHVRFQFDREATVEDQLTWLREAGFTHVDCVWKQHRFALLAAWV